MKRDLALRYVLALFCFDSAARVSQLEARTLARDVLTRSLPGLCPLAHLE
ncbi:hypothetical protein GCM10007857_63220 [Bradyrhizobium iriomotense]|uniref:Uncharacterized protein n=1 Tax=Bradyrhizobium iriomotense TaxID=441950 RepID=A0ABQ6B6B5_9BRAD|nr:hypothetical protein GCM10007857_63220 [Bradyrhizobium iriomotense]